MRKLRLELDTLVVESFSPAGGPAARGTVRGHLSLYWEDCSPDDTQGGFTCDPTDQSCNGTCVHTCEPGGCGGGGSAGCGGGSDPAVTCNGVICVEDTGP
jgi:hypothetical protein